MTSESGLDLDRSFKRAAQLLHKTAHYSVLLVEMSTFTISESQRSRYQRRNCTWGCSFLSSYIYGRPVGRPLYSTAVVLSSSFFLLLFSSPILSGRRLNVYHTSTHDVALMRI